MKFIVLGLLILVSSPIILADEGFSIIHVSQLEKLIQSKKSVYIFDANTEKTRIESGLIPGAMPMDSVSQYDPNKILPRDKKAKLIFYCHSTS